MQNILVFVEIKLFAKVTVGMEIYEIIVVVIIPFAKMMLQLLMSVDLLLGY